MATIEGALKSKLLEEFRLPETELRAPLRPLYVAGELFDDIDTAVDLHDPHKGKGGRTLFEHLEQTFSDFRCSTRPLVGDLNRLVPTASGLWKIHSSGLRVFGWVPHPHGFVAVKMAMASECHGKGNVVGVKFAEVLKFAEHHGLQGSIQKGDRIALFPT